MPPFEGFWTRDIKPEKFSQVKRLPSGYGFEDCRVFFLLVSVRAGDVEVAPVDGKFLPEIICGRESFAVKEFVFNEAADGFDASLCQV